MKKIYDVIFSAVMVSKGLEWWELLESQDFQIVESLCQDLDGFNQDEFNEWESQMAEDL